MSGLAFFINPMAKRFTDTEIWEQDWFVALPNKYKLFYMYIKDKCDDSGVWRPNKEIIQRIIGEPIQLNEFLVYVNTDEKMRILQLENGRWFLKDYFHFQYGDSFNPSSPVHRGVLKRLITHGIHIKELNKVNARKMIDADFQQLREIAYEYPNNTLLISFGYPIHRVKDKDKDINKNTLKENNTLRGQKVSEDFEEVYFSDGSSQKNGPQQQENLKNGYYKAKDIVKGSIY